MADRWWFAVVYVFCKYFTVVIQYIWNVVMKNIHIPGKLQDTLWYTYINLTIKHKTLERSLEATWPTRLQIWTWILEISWAVCISPLSPVSKGGHEKILGCTPKGTYLLSQDTGKPQFVIWVWNVCIHRSPVIRSPLMLKNSHQLLQPSFPRWQDQSK